MNIIVNVKDGKLHKKIIYGGSSKIIFDGHEFDTIPQYEMGGSLDGDILPYSEGSDFGDYLIENWNLFAYRSKSIHIDKKNASIAFSQLKKKLNNEKAAGGVLREKDKYLMIKRNGFWEFPKGKLEKKENWESAATREVGEETGVNGIISSEIHTTYHVYKRSDKINLKETRWYGMELIGEYDLKPQAKEGITEAGFFKKDEVERLLLGSYDNMIITWEHYKRIYNL